jgi:hypothetical protein
MIKDMEERKMVEKILEMKVILETSQRKIKMSILHVAYAKGQITPRNIFDGAGKRNVDTVKNLEMRRKFVAAKISFKQISLKNTSVRMINVTTSNIFSILHKIPMMKTSSKILMTPSK